MRKLLDFHSAGYPGTGQAGRDAIDITTMQSDTAGSWSDTTAADTSWTNQ